MNNRTGKKSIVNEDLFINKSEFNEYFIGLMATDGYIGKTDYTIQISLKDKEILEVFSKITNVPIYERFDKRFNSKIYSYRFRNKNLHKYFSQIGITNNKTKNIKIKIPLTNHILRGIFDGDGSIFKNNYNNNIINIVSASEEFILQIKNYLENNNVRISSLIFHNNVFNINIYKKSEVKNFYNLIYENATLYIERKYIRFNAISNGNI